jgi:pilus assembly protein CpaC
VPDAQTAAQVVALLDSFMIFRDPALQNESGESGGSGGDTGGSGGGNSSTTPWGPGTGRGVLAARNGKVINRLRVSMPTQVVVRVRVAEVNRNLSEQLGIKWQIGREGVLFGENFKIGLAESAVSVGVSLTSGEDMLAAAAAIPVDLGALIDALAVENLVSVLAEPNLSVVSGENASFLAGGEIPFPTSDGQGGTGVEFKEFGVLLGVTPTILSPRRISLRLRPEVSEPSTANGVIIQGTVVPGFVTRRAETTVELASGQSVAIGGLLRNNLVNEINKIPLLGDIPIIGALARSTSFSRNETELVIVVTAYLSEPSERPLNIPNADIYVPYFFNRLFVGQKPEVRPGPLRPDDFIY